VTLPRRSFLAATAGLAAPVSAAQPPYQVGAYYFPNFHVDPRNEKIHGPGWTEWELLKRAEPKFAGHQQPKKPLWGYTDESDPRVFAGKIDAAADHGLTHFIFDWYWYNDGPFLERGLERGYLAAPNNQRLRFCLMWANHDWVDIHPAKRGVPAPLLYPGAITRETFEKMTDYIVSRYFQHPSYWSIDGCPYFSVYELYRLVEGLGGVDKTREALQSFRRKTRAAGFRDLHLNAVVWGVKILPGEKSLDNPAAIVKALGVDSVTSYVWIHHVPLDQFPETPYRAVAAAARKHWTAAAGQYGVPYHPNVTMGWDSSPRTAQSDRFTNSGYPYMAAMSGNTPAAFGEALAAAKAFLDRDPAQPKILNLNAWNEWTEGSYLEPDTVSGFGYLEAIKRVFRP
jgi:hypothetical protein